MTISNLTETEKRIVKRCLKDFDTLVVNEDFSKEMLEDFLISAMREVREEIAENIELQECDFKQADQHFIDGFDYAIEKILNSLKSQ